MEREDAEAEDNGRASCSWGLFSPSISLKAASLKVHWALLDLQIHWRFACVPDGVPTLLADA